MKILIITYYYTPAISPRAFRWTTIAEYWAKKGEYVKVICSWEPGLERSEIINDVHIHRIGNTAVKMLRKRLKDNDSIKNVTLKEKEKSKNKLSLFLKYIYNHTWKKIYWPDFACLWYFSALKKAKYLLTTGKYDRLITVSIPFTCHMIGLNIKKHNPDLLWIMDIGDPFYVLDATPVNNHKIYRRLNYLTERKIINYTDIITVTTEALLKMYGDLFPKSNKKIYVIPPLISLSENNNNIDNHIFIKKNMIRLVFVGTLYKTIRSPYFLLKYFKKLLQTSLGDRLELHFFGDINDCASSFEFYEDLLNNKIFIHGLVTHNVALQATKEADFLINVGNNTFYQLPSKMVEYMSSGKPIINFISSSNDSSLPLIKDYPFHLNIIDNNITKENNVLLLENFIKNSIGKVVNPKKLKQIINPFTEDKIIEQYTKLIYKGEYI